MGLEKLGKFIPKFYQICAFFADNQKTLNQFSSSYFNFLRKIWQMQILSREMVMKNQDIFMEKTRNIFLQSGNPKPFISMPQGK